MYFIYLGPKNEAKNFFNSSNFGKIKQNDLNTIVQYEKFYQTFEMIQPILDANSSNIVILDRTPFSELVWSPFFNRESEVYKTKDLMNNFLQLFENIKSQMLYIELTANTENLANRIILREEDYINFITAFDLLKNPTIKQNEYIDPSDPDFSKILYMINFVKEQYNSIKLLLRKNGILAETYSNNTKEDMFNCVDNILKYFN